MIVNVLYKNLVVKIAIVKNANVNVASVVKQIASVKQMINVVKIANVAINMY